MAIFAKNNRQMIHKVATFIEQNKLLSADSKVLVAVSGGADSVALLLVLQKLNYNCEAIHCNFHLRDEESNRDEAFVRNLCQRLNVRLNVTHLDTRSYAKEKGISIEMAAREQRYAIFEEYRREISADAIAVAHHKNDTAETVLLNMLRGTGIKGLRGIQARNGNIVRPLLCVERNEITEYLKYRGEEYVTDSTNLSTDFTRNKIRLEILPLMQSINPSITDTIAQTADRMCEAEKVYAQSIEGSIARVLSGNVIDIEKLIKEPSPRSLLHEILHPKGFNSTQTDNIFRSLDSDSGRRFDSNMWSVIKDRTSLIITPKESEGTSSYLLKENASQATPSGLFTCIAQPFNGKISKQKEIATIDADKVRMPLTIRLWQQGDRFTPYGMRGSKLVSDYMTDRKMSIAEKRRQPIITDADGKIVWLAGERTAAHCCIDEKTKNILRIEWQRI